MVCGKQLRHITPTHLHTHGWTMEQYREVFSEAPLMDSKFLKTRSDGGCLATTGPDAWCRSEENVNKLRSMAKQAGIFAQKSPKTLARWEKARDAVKQRESQEVVRCQEKGVQCQICGKWFRDITNTHLELHGTTQEEYAKRFGCGVKGAGSIEAQSESMKRLFDEGNGTEIWSQAAKRRWEDPEYRERQTAVLRDIWTPEKREEHGIILSKLWEDPEHRTKMARVRANQSHSGPTSIECILYGILDNLGVEYETQVPIDGYVVDALVENWLVLEAYGDYWHNYPDGRDCDKVRDGRLRNLNFQVLPFWGHQLRDDPEGCADRVSYVLDCT